MSFTLMFYSLRSVKPQQLSSTVNKFPKQAMSYEESSLIDFDSLGDSMNFSSLKNSDSLNYSLIDKSFESQQNLANLPPKSMADLLNKTNDFKSNHNSTNNLSTPIIAYWYGLCKFVVITPTRAANYIDNETKANIILSSAAVAINNTGWFLVFFFNILYIWHFN
jgi:hypothetical protein